MPAKRIQWPPRRRSILRRWAMAIAAGVAIAGCRPSPPPQSEALNPTPPTPTDAPETAPETAATQPPADPTPAAPATTPTTTLPDALLREWQPLSDVLLAFGPMTLTASEVQWRSGQSSPYTLISTDDGYVLELEASPSFYDTQNRYIKLIPKADANTADSIEVAFYTSSDQLQSDEYIMYGGYFAE